MPQLCPSFALHFPPFYLCVLLSLKRLTWSQHTHTHTLSLSLSLRFLSISAVVERLTIAARFTFLSITQSWIDMLWFNPLSCLPISQTRAWTIHPLYTIIQPYKGKLSV